MRRLDAHSLHSPWRPMSDHNHLPYVGNGYLGVATTGGAAKQKTDSGESDEEVS